MNKIIKRSLLIGSLVLFWNASFAYKYLGPRDQKEENANQEVESSRAAACSPATGLTNLEFNNVKALIETGGSLWQDRAQSRAAYIVPKNDPNNLSVLYAGALWMGGRSPDNQLKLAAVRYRGSGDDFWPGPLTVGNAEVDETVCEEYDRFFEINRIDAVNHRIYWDALLAGEDISEIFPDGYVMPSYFEPDQYPAMGDIGQSDVLAPFYDYNNDGIYDPEFGDYPGYDVFQEIDCRALDREDPVPLFGDKTYYWIFNDKGNVHSETQGQPIGMEIRAQAFAFATQDEINNMTFYNYQLINQGTQTLNNTFFGQYADPDVGTSQDDYVGCDVQRGLGYCYNGDANDESSTSSFGYGLNPPAVGIDFFEGPYQDDDGIDNPDTLDYNIALDNDGIPYTGLGIGYGDGIIDNERFGMRKFIYYNNSSNPGIGDPQIAAEHYNYMTGFWRDGTPLTYGGTGYQDGDVETDYMFPFDSDPVFWGTGGVEVEPWYEEGEGTAPEDRRFIQSAGPFTLEPGAWNNITVGCVYARATTGSPFASVQLLLSADDKAQALFDNCFEIVEGPTAPDLTIQELENKLIFILTNESQSSNNTNETQYDENLVGFDPIIPADPTISNTEDSLRRSYQFEGYMVYQLKSEDVSPSELDDEDQARLIFQCDVENGIDQIINFEVDPDIPFPVPVEKVDGADEGIVHSFEITTDAFAQGDDELVNHKTYYYMAIAYSYNNYEDYNTMTGSGQAEQFLASRNSSTGSLQVVSAIPHTVVPEAGGTTLLSDYADGVSIRRHEGKGNGNLEMDITAQSEEIILASTFIDELDYEPGKGPVDIKVIDPTRVVGADFELKLSPDDEDFDSEDAKWRLVDLTNNDTIFANRAFKYKDEFILLDYGISITFSQYEYVDPDGDEEVEMRFTEFVSSSKEYANPSIQWLDGVPDGDGFFDQNWIRAGNVQAGDDAPAEEVVYDDAFEAVGGSAVAFFDGDSDYENVVEGTWAPFCLTGMSTPDVTTQAGTVLTLPYVAPRLDLYTGQYDWTVSSGDNNSGNIRGLNNVDVVFTSDKSKWTRCGVLEMQSIPALTNTGDREKMQLRDAPSVDKNGRKAGDDGYNDAEGTLNGAQPTGMGWFPGYAIDVGTGERLNMCFGEDSWLTNDNGADMIWNPSSTLYESFNPHFGGQHWIYVFKNSQYELDAGNYMPAYDQGQYIYDGLEDSGQPVNVKRVFSACTWVGSAIVNEDFPLLSVEEGLIPTETRIRLRVAKPYEKYSPVTSDVDNPDGSENFWNPYYTFSTKPIATSYNSNDVLGDAMDDINVVPNPYYAYSEYENNKLDNRIKITNLPEECTVTIYNVSGTLVRQYRKDDPLTWIEWDLKNSRNIPIAGGVYIIHVDIPDVGEKVLKWFGVIRPVDLDNF